jgi:hypothetical protein
MRVPRLLGLAGDTGGCRAATSRLQMRLQSAEHSQAGHSWLPGLARFEHNTELRQGDLASKVETKFPSTSSSRRRASHHLGA